MPDRSRGLTGPATVRRPVQDRYNSKLPGSSTDSAWKVGGCQSWYLDETGKNVTLWPGPTWQFRRQAARFKPDEYRRTDAVEAQVAGAA